MPSVVRYGMPVNRLELRTLLEAEDIRRDAYDLSGQGKSEAFIREDSFRWSVFYSERGLERDTHTFATEAEACDHLLANLRNDPNTH